MRVKSEKLSRLARARQSLSKSIFKSLCNRSPNHSAENSANTLQTLYERSANTLRREGDFFFNLVLRIKFFKAKIVLIYSLSLSPRFAKSTLQKSRSSSLVCSRGGFPHSIINHFLFVFCSISFDRNRLSIIGTHRFNLDNPLYHHQASLKSLLKSFSLFHPPTFLDLCNTVEICSSLLCHYLLLMFFSCLGDYINWL